VEALGSWGGVAWPRLVFWETTAGCNLECIHCRRLEVSRELSKRDLTTEESKNLIAQLAECGRPLLVLSGGEPLMRPDIFDLADHARQQGLACAMATNGTLVDRAVAGKIAAAGIRRVSVSLDGADAATHDRFRGIAGSFDRALEGIGHLRAVGAPVQINMTLARHNIEQMEALFALTKRIGAVALHVFALVPVGCGVEIADAEMLSPEQTEATLARFYELAKRSRLETRATCAPQYSRLVRQRRATEREAGGERSEAGGEKREARVKKPDTDFSQPTSRGPEPGRGCLAGSGVCFISHDGKVFPCGYLPVEAGDVRREKFATIWRESPVFARLRRPDLLTGKCGACEFAQVCLGCRARAYSQTGDFMSEEPSCPYVPRRKRKSE
jgi:radical SAM protein with 4Fe4S-binding SPASM domain